jgi:hypothetical protein
MQSGGYRAEREQRGEGDGKGVRRGESGPGRAAEPD